MNPLPSLTRLPQIHTFKTHEPERLPGMDEAEILNWLRWGAFELRPREVGESAANWLARTVKARFSAWHCEPLTLVLRGDGDGYRFEVHTARARTVDLEAFVARCDCRDPALAPDLIHKIGVAMSRFCPVFAPEDALECASRWYWGGRTPAQAEREIVQLLEEHCGEEFDPEHFDALASECFLPRDIAPTLPLRFYPEHSVPLDSELELRCSPDARLSTLLETLKEMQALPQEPDTLDCRDDDGEFEPALHLCLGGEGGAYWELLREQLEQVWQCGGSPHIRWSLRDPQQLEAATLTLERGLKLSVAVIEALENMA